MPMIYRGKEVTQDSCASEVVQGNPHQDVKITKVTNGFILKIGCKTFVGFDWTVISHQLREYWEDPIKAEQKYTK